MAQDAVRIEQSLVIQNTSNVDVAQLLGGSGIPSGAPTPNIVGTIYTDTGTGNLYTWNGSSWDNVSSSDSNRIYKGDTEVLTQDADEGDSESRILFNVDGLTIGEFDGNGLHVNGNIQANGTITYIASNEVDIGDNIIRLNADLLTGGANGGIAVKRVGTFEVVDYTSGSPTGVTTSGTSPQNQLVFYLDNALTFSLALNDTVQLKSSGAGNNGMYFVSSYTDTKHFTLTAIDDIITDDEDGALEIAQVSAVESELIWDEAKGSWTFKQDQLVLDNKKLYFGNDKDFLLGFNTSGSTLELSNGTDGLLIDVTSNTLDIRPKTANDIVIKNYANNAALLTVDYSDASIVLADGSKTASNAAPDSDTEITNKKYVDDQDNKIVYKTSGTHTSGATTTLDTISSVNFKGGSWQVYLDNAAGDNDFFGYRELYGVSGTGTNINYASRDIIKIGGNPTGLRVEITNNGTDVKLILQATENLNWRIARHSINKI